METKKVIGTCFNPNCELGKNQTPQEVELDDEGQAFCKNPECKMLLDIPSPKRLPIKKIITVAVPLIVLGLLIWGGISLFSGKSEQQERNKSDLLSKISNIDKTEAPANNENQTATTESNPVENKSTPETHKNTSENKSDHNNLTANSIEEYFQKIADNSISYNKKDNLKKEIVSKYFSDEKTIVVEIGANNTEVNHTEIKDYVEELSQQHYKIKIIKKETNGNQKITKLFIKEL